jgi:hypothetical protein
MQQRQWTKVLSIWSESFDLDREGHIPIKPFCILMGKFTIVASLSVDSWGIYLRGATTKLVGLTGVSPLAPHVNLIPYLCYYALVFLDQKVSYLKSSRVPSPISFAHSSRSTHSTTKKHRLQLELEAAKEFLVARIKLGGRSSQSKCHRCAHNLLIPKRRLKLDHV